MYSTDFKVSLDEASRRLALQEPIGDLTSEIEMLIPDRFVAAWVNNGSTYGATVLISPGDPLVEVNSLVESSGLPVTIEVSERPLLAQMVAAIKELGPQIRSDYPTQNGIQLDERLGEIVVEIPDQELRTERRAITSVAAGEVTVRLEYVPGRTREGQVGGFQFGVSSTPTSQQVANCTIGFSIRSLTNPSLTRTTTAYHCFENGTTGWFRGLPGPGPWHKMVLGSSLRNEHLEIRSFATDSSYPPKAEWVRGSTSTTTRTAVTSVQHRASTNVGDYKCHRGTTTGYSCGTVSTIYLSPDACGPSIVCDYTWIQVDDAGSLRCFVGDSGGPVGLENAAAGWYWGQYSGGQGVGQCGDFVYWSADYLPEFSVTVLRQ